MFQIGSWPWRLDLVKNGRSRPLKFIYWNYFILVQFMDYFHFSWFIMMTHSYLMVVYFQSSKMKLADFYYFTLSNRNDYLGNHEFTRPSSIGLGEFRSPKLFARNVFYFPTFSEFLNRLFLTSHTVVIFDHSFFFLIVLTKLWSKTDWLVFWRFFCGQWSLIDRWPIPKSWLVIFDHVFFGHVLSGQVNFLFHL